MTSLFPFLCGYYSLSFVINVVISFYLLMVNFDGIWLHTASWMAGLLSNFPFTLPSCILSHLCFRRSVCCPDFQMLLFSTLQGHYTIAICIIFRFLSLLLEWLFFFFFERSKANLWETSTNPNNFLFPKVFLEQGPFLYSYFITQGKKIHLTLFL